MEIANELWQIRPATRQDSGQIMAMLREAPWSHLHADWHLPGDWIGLPTFVVAEPVQGGPLAGCFCLTADPPPAGWVRMAAVRDTEHGASLLQQMVDAALALGREEVLLTEMAWLAREEQTEAWLSDLGLARVNEVVTYLKRSLELPPDAHPNTAVAIRPVQLDDLACLVTIEEKAFEPIWRHSLEGLALGWQQALSFHVATMEGQVVGFQYSARSDQPRAAHLVRLTVDPALHRMGVGSALLESAIAASANQGYDQITLNTQVDNYASQRLYERYGFVRVGYPLPVWSRSLVV